MTYPSEQASDALAKSMSALPVSHSTNRDDRGNFFPETPARLAPFPQQTQDRQAIPTAIHPVTLITTECVAITSAMRKHGRLGQSTVSAILGGGSGILREKSVKSSSPRTKLSQREIHTTRSVDKGVKAPDGDGNTLAGRWGLRGQRGKSQRDHPIISAFAQLRSDLSTCQDISSFDSPSLLQPFLQVIRSSSTSASITSLAVGAVTKFFAYNLITLESPRIALAMQLLSAAITHCRFEASDSSADEIVLLRILKLMEIMLLRSESRLLGDESVCEIMETGLSMCCQSRLSEVLRRAAEMAMISMCQVIFGQLKALAVEPEASDTYNEVTNMSRPARGVKMDPSVDGDTIISPNTTEVEDKLSPEDVIEGGNHNAASQPETTVKYAQATADDSADVAPYSLPSIRELFRVLIDLLDPHNKQHTDPMRIIALRIINVALEIAGPAIAKQPSLSQLVKNDLCRHLFQLVRSEHMLLLNGSLQVAGTLFQTCRDVLKLQQEVFLSYLVACLHPRVDIPQEPGIDPSLYQGIPQAPKLVKPPPSQESSGRSTPVPVRDRQKLGLEGGSRHPEARESMVESISALVRIPNFMTEIFVNYDCEVDRMDLCEDVVGLLCRNAFPDSATWSTTNVPPLCLDALLGYVQSMAERLDVSPLSSVDTFELEKLRAQRARKKVTIHGATKFNEDPKAGIAYLAAKGIISDPNDPVQVARFLKGTARISKKVLGDYISKKSSEDILEGFIRLFDFEGKRIDEALRELLGSFRLPGEAPLIARIVTVFAERYCSTAASQAVEDKDAAFVLTYAIIMLNTDQHNPNVKKQNRMSFDDFAKNLRGVNAGKDFESEYLQAIYNAIKQDEIILPDEHDNKKAFDYAWKELLTKTATAGDLQGCETNAYDADMFEATWKPVVGTLCYVLLQASDDAVYSRVVNGFDQCAQIAVRYEIEAAFDRIISSLCTISTLSLEKTTALNTEVQAGKKTVVVSELAVHFGRDFTAQLATVLLFKMLLGNEALLRESWVQVIKILQNLFVNALIRFPPQDMGLAGLDPIPLRPPSQIIDRDGQIQESGLFSAFTSYLSSYAAGDPPEPTDEELENTLCTVDCLNACQTDSLLRSILALPANVASSIVHLILDQLPDESSPIVIVKPERPPPSQPDASRPAPDATGYHPGTLFLLEFATTLVLREESTIDAAGESLNARLQTLVRDAANLHPLLAARTIHYLLRLLQRGYTRDFMRTPVVLHALSSFDDATIKQAAEPIISGVLQNVSVAEPLRNEMASSPDFWSILQRLHTHESQAQSVFNILETVVQAEPAIISAENYEPAVMLSNDFAALAGNRVNQEVRRQKDTRKDRGPQKPSNGDGVISRAAQAISIIYQLTRRIPEFILHSHLERSEAWTTYWSPAFHTLSNQCLNPCREVRHKALNCLQRCLLSPDLLAPANRSPNGKHDQEADVTHSRDYQVKIQETDIRGESADNHEAEWLAIFHEVLFPLLYQGLLKPEVYALDASGMSETRTQAATLLCKVFLHFLDRLYENGRMLEIWLQVLAVLDRLMNSGQEQKQQQQQHHQQPQRNGKDGVRGVSGNASAALLEEEIPESLKNCLLVMAGAGYLVPPAATAAAAVSSESGRDVQQQQQQQQQQTGEQELEASKNGRAVNGKEEQNCTQGQSQGHEPENASKVQREDMMWSETRRRVQRLSPGLFDAIFPPESLPEPPPQPQPEPPPQQQQQARSLAPSSTPVAAQLQASSPA